MSPEAFPHVSKIGAGPRGGRAAGAVFDRLAAKYDREFTDSLIGRAQRKAVWRVLLKTFRADDNVLELNCGTGEDAFFMADHGVSVFACDASRKMIERAEERLKHRAPPLPIVFCQLATERIAELNPAQRFDGVFSNFSGLNCVADLEAVASSLSTMVKRGDRLLLCFSTRFCVVEMLYHLSRGEVSKGMRRCKGRTEAKLEGASLTVYYPSLPQIRRSFAKDFRLCSRTGIGVAVPPSYLEPWVRRHPACFRQLCRLDGLLASLPILRSTGDHILLCFEKVSL